MPLSRSAQHVGAFITFLAVILLVVYLIFSTLGLGNEVVFVALFGSALIGTITLCIVLIRKYRKEGQPTAIDYLNVGTQRYILGLFMIFYGVPKLFGTFFDYQLFALDSKLYEASEFELAWYFYGKNRWQELFAGIMEFVPGVLLLNRRTYYIGALVLLPVTAQVFVLNFFFRIGGITLPAATILLACNLYIIYSEKEKITQFFRSLDFSRSVEFGRAARTAMTFCKWTIIVLAVLVVFRNVQRNFFKETDKANYDALVGVYTMDSVSKNGAEYSPAMDSLLYKDIYIERQSRWNILRRFNSKTDAYVMKLSPDNDSISLYINKGGIGDDPDVLDSLTVLKGVYQLKGETLSIDGTQSGDTLHLVYRKQDIQAKKWFW